MVTKQNKKIKEEKVQRKPMKEILNQDVTVKVKTILAWGMNGFFFGAIFMLMVALIAILKVALAKGLV